MSGTANTLSILTPTNLQVGTVLVLTGSYSGADIAGLDYTVDFGATWTPMLGLSAGGGSWRGFGPVITSAATLIATVRRSDNQSVQATTNLITVIPPAGVPDTLTINDPVGAIQGSPILLTGGYTGSEPAALDYSLTGTTWNPLADYSPIAGNWTATGPVPSGGGTLTIQVRDRNATSVMATTNPFTVTALSPTPGVVRSFTAGNARFRATSAHAFFAANPDQATGSVTFEARLAQHIAATGSVPGFMNVSVDTGASPSSWSASNDYLAWSWSLSSARSMIPILSIPLSSRNETNRLPVFAAFAAGDYDASLRLLITRWRDYGFPLIYVRLGWDANLPQTAWRSGTSAAEIAAWIAAFQHASDVLRNISGVTVKVIYTPAISGGDGVQFEAKYPGDGYVDVIGLDLSSALYPADFFDWSLGTGYYDPDFSTWAAPSANRTHYWDWPSATQLFPTGVPGDGSAGLGYVLYFASAHGKNVCIPQSGVGAAVIGGTPAVGISLWDDPAFPAHLSQSLFAAGAPYCEFVSAWDAVQPSADWTFSDPSYTGALAKPMTTAAWANLFNSRSACQGSIDLSWVAPAASQGPLSYVVQQRISGSEKWSQIGPPITDTFYTATNLLAGSSYDFQVAAMNANGQGPWATANAILVPNS